MKKLLYTIACSFIAINAFSQKIFKQISFHQKFSTKGASLLDNRPVAVTTLPGPKNGTVIINSTDSTITVNVEGESAATYKIKMVQDETADKYDHKKLPILCTNSRGVPCTAIIDREYAYKRTNEMIFTIGFPNGDAKGYVCTYIENLF